MTLSAHNITQNFSLKRAFYVYYTRKVNCLYKLYRKIVTGKKPLRKRKAQGEEMENEQEELKANEIRVTVKRKRCQSMGHLKPERKYFTTLTLTALMNS